MVGAIGLHMIAGDLEVIGGPLVLGAIDAAVVYLLSIAQQHRRRKSGLAQAADYSHSRQCPYAPMQERQVNLAFASSDP